MCRAVGQGRAKADYMYMVIKLDRSVCVSVAHHTGQMRPIIQLERAAFWAIWGDSGYYGDPQTMRKSSF